MNKVIQELTINISCIPMIRSQLNVLNSTNCLSIQSGILCTIHTLLIVLFLLLITASC